MPRRPRDDIQPEIQLPDISEQLQRARDVVGANCSVVVFDRSSPIGRESRLTVFDGTLENRLRDCRAFKVGIDEGFLNMLIHSCEQADVRNRRNANGDPVYENGLRVLRLVRVGCRVRATQEALAAQYARNRQWVNRQISLLKEWGFIVNWGNGWYELDANLCWKGNLSYCAAYREVQRVRGQVTITDGNTTSTIGQDGDAQVGMHTSPAPQRERGE